MAAIGTWTEALHQGHSAFASLTRPVDGLTAFAGDTAFVLGGVSSGDDHTRDARNTVLPGLVMYDMSSGKLSNTTATAYYGTGSAQRGQMVHVPLYGPRGLYAMLGGHSAPPAKGFASGHGLLSFTNITLYDPAARQWHWQTAEGEVPPRRQEFCAAGARSTNGTYEM
jgi:hypothetical protein